MPASLDKFWTEAQHLAGKLTGAKKRNRRTAFAAFDAAVDALGPGSLAIDLGANVGEVAERLAATGADVICFEPDPHAFARLSARLGDRPNVTLHNAAAGGAASTAQLYRRVDFEDAPDRHSTSSSLFGGKHKMDAGGVTVDVVDFPAFLAGLDRDVDILKIDIEGAEVPLMEALLDHPAHARVARMFIETHERVVPELAARTRALKARTAPMPRPAVNWDWH